MQLACLGTSRGAGSRRRAGLRSGAATASRRTSAAKLANWTRPRLN